MKTGYADLPLHSGKCPRWLFKRMKELARAISQIIVYEYDQEEFLKRLSDPIWFQALGCTLGFDFHSSGLTTTTTAALKEALNSQETGIKIVGGKGKTSRKVPEEIENSDLSTKTIQELKKSSKLSACVDTSCLQDRYSLYHHVFVFSEKGNWITIQQGMNPENKFARRYHWLSSNLKDFTEEPHSAICCDNKEVEVLDLTSKQSREVKKISLDLVKDNPEHLKRYLKPKQTSLMDFSKSIQTSGKLERIKKLQMQKSHVIRKEDLSSQVIRNLKKAYEIQPGNFEELICLKGIGKKSIRALALISDLIYNEKPSTQDPVQYSFTVGGKDSQPFPIDPEHYNSVNETLKNAVENAKIGKKDKMKAIKRLSKFLVEE